jgi:hypothetical protein
MSSVSMSFSLEIFTCGNPYPLYVSLSLSVLIIGALNGYFSGIINIYVTFFLYGFCQIVYILQLIHNYYHR